MIAKIVGGMTTVVAETVV